MNRLKHAWLVVQPEDRDETIDRLAAVVYREGEDGAERRLAQLQDGPQTMISAPTVGELVDEANRILRSLGVADDRLLSDVDYRAMPGEVPLGGGLVARLYACDERGVNHTEPAEPSASALGL